MRCDHAFYGSVTVGERGQIVIPSEARADLGFQQGDKLLVMRHPAHNGLMVFKFEAVEEFIEEFKAGLERVSRSDAEGEEQP